MPATSTPTKRRRPEKPTGGCGVRVSHEVRDATIIAVAELHGVQPREILSRARIRPISYARQEVMWRLRSLRAADGLPKHSYATIAAALGGLDHTTVIFGVRAHAARLGQ